MAKKKSNRPSKVEYYMNIAKEVSKRSTCMSTQLGAIIVRDDQIIATGYNGAPRKTMDCQQRGECLRRKLGIPSGERYELCRSVHAEQNAIINAARAGVSLLDGDLYLYAVKVYNGENTIVNAVPCFVCKKLVINAGLKNAYCMNKDGEIDKYSIEDWQKEWTEGDMIADTVVYNSDYYKNK